MIVVDASVLYSALADDGADGSRTRARLDDEALHAPFHVDLETVSAIRNGWRRGDLDEGRAATAIMELAELTVQRCPPRPFISRIWELRNNVTPYDAAYVALAEVLDVVLVTADRPLKDAPGPTCQIELLT